MPLGCCLTGATDGYVRSFLGAPGVVSPEKDCVIAAVSFERRGGFFRRFPVSRPADMPRTRDEGASLYRPPPRPLRRSSSYDISLASIAALGERGGGVGRSGRPGRGARPGAGG